MKKYAPLRVPLNKLMYLDSNEIDQFAGLTLPQIASLREDYSADEIRAIGSAVISVCEEKDLDFFELMPELKERSYTHEQIEGYLSKIKPAFIELSGN